MRIAVVGAGAMGSVFGGLLAAGGCDVWLVDSWREHIDALSRDGLRIEVGGGERIVPVKATTDPGRVGPVDLVLVQVKSTETAAATRAAGPLIDDETIFLTLQNGLGNREAIAAVVGEKRALAGVTYDSAAMVGPGHVRHTNVSRTYVGEMDGRTSPRVERIAAVFSSAGIPTSVSDNLLDLQWGKLLVNAAANAAGAITGCTAGELVRHAGSRELTRLVAEETAAVARAVGADLPDDAAAKVHQALAAAGDSKPSMLQDVERGRRTEIDAINGAVVREGERVGVPTPYNQALTLLVQAIESRRHGEERSSEG